MFDRIRITDVAPRDGLQAESEPIPTLGKIELVQAIQESGVDEVEVSSFVSPKWVPQLGDAGAVFAALASGKPAGVLYSALVPNERGMDALLAANERARREHGVERLIDKVAVFTAASEAFSQRNTNATIEETIRRFEPVVERAHAIGLMVRGYISCVVACPFAGAIEPEAVGRVAAMLIELGVDEIDLGDTIGGATVETIEPVILEAIERLGSAHTNRFGEPTLTLHLHDTFGRAGACVAAAIDLGVRSFDASTAGIGGCPYASTDAGRAPGNIAMRTLLETIEGMGLKSGVDRSKHAIARAVAAKIMMRVGMTATPQELDETT